jgi:hypothetical protein
MRIDKYVRRASLAAAAVAVGGASLVLGGAGSAWASNTQVSAVGSFTTFQMMHDLFPTSVNNISPDALAGSQTETIVADAQTCTAGLTYSTSLQPPNGSGQGKTALAAEEGAAATAQGCIDFSRSSSPSAPHVETLPSGGTEGGDPAASNLDYYAYALDGVDVVVGANAMPSGNTTSANLESPVVLTLQQIQNIYSCWNPATSTPITTWAQAGVGSSTDTIVRYWPQAGSGTRAVYTDVLGFDPTVLAVGVNHCATAPIVSFTAGSVTAPNEENSEDGIVYANSLSGVGHQNIADAIYIYSAGKLVQAFNDKADFKSTANNVVAQELTGTTNTIGNFNPALVLAQVQNSVTHAAAPFTTYAVQTGLFNPNTNRGQEAINPATVTEANEWYSHLPPTTGGNPSDSTAPVPGIRYVYNVTDTKLPGYNGAKALVGFDNQASGTPSALCRGDDSATIISDGFVPLSNSTTNAPAGSDKANVACREFPGLSFPGQGGSLQWTTGTWPQP